MATTGTPRGCGMRIAGGIYIEVDLVDGNEPGSVPFESTIVCPAAPVDVDALGISPVGVKLINVNGTYHVFDWIGSQHYPNVADFVEESRRMGISRRLAKTLDFDLLTRDSRLILIHARASIDNVADYHRVIGPIECPRGLDPDHDDHCLGVSWRDLDPRTTATAGRRDMPSFTYPGSATPDTIAPVYRPAIFMSLPISRLAVVRDDVDGTHEDALDRLAGSAIPVTLEDC